MSSDKAQMSNNEMELLARRIASAVMRELSASGLGGSLGGGADEAFNTCFTCSGRFKCRPSFIIQDEGISAAE